MKGLDRNNDWIKITKPATLTIEISVKSTKKEPSKILNNR